jgi:farnesyl-diphosphate farnesyltransferase
MTGALEVSRTAWEKSAQCLLKSTARSFYLSLHFLPSEVRPCLGLAYLLARATDTIADASNSPLDQRSRALEALENLLHTIAHKEDEKLPDEGIAEAAASILKNVAAANANEGLLLKQTPALLQALNTLPTNVSAEIKRVLETIIAAQRRDLVRFGYASESAPQSLPVRKDTVDYTYAVAGCVGEFWTRLCDARIPNYARVPLDLLLEHGRLFGQGLQLVNILRDMPADLREGRCYLPSEELSALGLTSTELIREPVKARPLINSWIQQARAWLAHGAQYVQGINGGRLRFSVSLPRLIGEQTLDLIEKTRPLETTRRLRVSKTTVYQCALAAIMESIDP